jgi:hypothetical protein
MSALSSLLSSTVPGAITCLDNDLITTSEENALTELLFVWLVMLVISELFILILSSLYNLKAIDLSSIISSSSLLTLITFMEVSWLLLFTSNCKASRKFLLTFRISSLLLSINYSLSPFWWKDPYSDSI